MEGKMVHFVGAGPGAPDLITVRGARLLEEADVIIYAGSLVNPALLEMKKESCRVCDSAKMTLEEVIETIKDAEKEGLTTVRLHTGDPCIYGAVREQMGLLEEAGIRYDSTPGVSSFCGAAAALDLEYTLPGISQLYIPSNEFAAPDAGEVGQKMALLGALTLYLDFINLFLYLLRLFGDRRS